MTALLNLGSLLLGLIAWLLPVVNLMRYEKHAPKNWVTLSIMSFTACTISLFFQIFNNYHLVKNEKTYAIMDTSGGVTFVAAVLLIVTIILNATTLIIYRNKTAK